MGMLRRSIAMAFLLVITSPLSADVGGNAISNPGVPGTVAGASAGSAARASGASPGTAAPSGSADNFLFTGSFLYSIPIVVPPGVAGLQPDLAIQYNSSAGNGWLGQGWDLSMGSLQRSNKAGPPFFTDADTFTVTLKGQTQELTRITDGTWRAVNEGAFQIFSRDGEGWLVQDKMGSRYRFGCVPTARLATSSGTFLWALNRAEDAHGNYLTVAYDIEAGQIYPAEILYTMNDAAGRTAARRVRFVREPRPDVTVSYRYGGRQETASRLARIETAILANGMWQAVRKVHLNYSVPVRRTRSHLASVRVEGVDGVQTLTLPPVGFTYQTGPGFTLTSPSASSPYNLPVDAAVWKIHDFNPDPNVDARFMVSRDNGVRVVELNGDGRPDLIRAIRWGAGAVLSQAWLNTTGGWVSTATWTLPVPATVVSDEGSTWRYRDNGLRFADLDGDGLTDAIRSAWLDNHFERQVWLNTGSGFTPAADNWLPPEGIRFFYDTSAERPADAGDTIADVNGDGRPDLLQSWVDLTGGTTHQAAWLNTGTGWMRDDRWAPAIPFVMAERPGCGRAPGFVSMPEIPAPMGGPCHPNFERVHMNGVQMIDVNGDGLADMVQGVLDKQTGANVRKTWLNTGPGWVEAPGYAVPHFNFVRGDGDGVGRMARDNGTQFADLNGDGLPDWIISLQFSNGSYYNYIHMNTGAGWVDATSAFPFPDAFTALDSSESDFMFHSTGQMVMDVDADGDADIVQSAGWFNGGNAVRRVTLGGMRAGLLERVALPAGGAIDLTYDTASRISGTHRIPFPHPVLTSMTTSDGRGGAMPVTYGYDGGLFDRTTREFLGFERVDMVDAAGARTVTWFHQARTPDGSAAPLNAFKGRAFRVERISAGGAVLHRTATLWERMSPHSQVHFVRVRSVTESLLDASPTESTRIEYEYDDAPAGAGLGNVVRIVHQGDTAFIGDERTEETEYALNMSAYMAGYPSRTRMRDAAGAVMAESVFLYDGLMSEGAITRGDVTAVRRWRDRPNPGWVETRAEYNASGQVTAMVDVLGARTETTYDDWGYPNSESNPLGHVALSAYDPRNGNIISGTDENGQSVRRRFDALGRMTAEIGPLDTESHPTLEIEHNDALLGDPSRHFIETRRREAHGAAGTIWARSYLDGLGRRWRSEEEASTGGGIIVDSEFDALGRAWRQSVPRYLSPASEPLWVERSFDALGRVIRVTKPDGTFTTTVYQGRAAWTQDEMGRTQSAVVDAYGQIVQRNETGIAAATTYRYDGLGRLVGLTDSQGAATVFEYDSLGRKTTLRDPSAGDWSYGYDDAGRMVFQTDPRGVVLSFTWDGLGRLLERRLSADPSGATGQPVGAVLARHTYDEVDAANLYARGRPTSIQDTAGLLRLFYDRLGRVVREDRTIDAMTYTARTAYDALSRVTSITYPDDSVVRYAYDAGGLLSAVTNEDGGVTYASFAGRDALGRALEARQGGGVTRLLQTFDIRNSRLMRRRVQHFAGGAWADADDRSYLYDAVGNVMGVADGLDLTRGESFTYDQLDRLVTAAGPYGGEAYSFDTTGRLLSKGRLMYAYDDPMHPGAVSGTHLSSSWANDAATRCAWHFDDTDPLYEMSGTLRAVDGSPVANVSVVLSGTQEAALRSDLLLGTNQDGGYRFRNVPGGPASTYSLMVSSFGMRATPAGRTAAPLLSSASGLDFTISAETAPINAAQLRVARTAWAWGAPLPGLSNGLLTGGASIGLGYGGQISSAAAWTQITGYAPLSDSADGRSHGPAQYVAPPEALSRGVVGPAFVAGQAGQGLAFNGITDGMVLPDTTGGSLSDVTWMLWVMPQAYPAFGVATLMAQSTASAAGALVSGARLALAPDGHVSLEIGRGGGALTLRSTRALPLNRWSLVSAVLRATGAASLHIDNREEVRVTSGAVASPSGLPISAGAGLTETRRFATGTFFRGILDEPRVQGRVWSAAEIASAWWDARGQARFTYDAAGNLIRKMTQSSTWTYRWDAEGRLSTVSEDGALRGAHVYDAAGGRVKKTDSSGTTLYIGSLLEIRPDGSEAAHVYASGELVCERVRDAAGTVRTYYYHGDHLGSLAVVTDAAGAVVQEQRYKPYGEVAISNGVSPMRLGFTGQEYDAESGLSDYGARYYDGALGQFISPDIFITEPYNPQNLNRYSYVHNNPLKYVDPSGYWRVSFSLHIGIGGHVSYDSDSGRFRGGVGVGHGSGASIGDGSWDIGYSQESYVDVGYDNKLKSAYLTARGGGGVQGLGVPVNGWGASGAYYFDQGEYEASAGVGYAKPGKNFQVGVNAGYSSWNDGNWSLGGSLYQTGVNYDIGSRSWAYNYSIDSKNWKKVFDDAVEDRKPHQNGYGTDGMPFKGPIDQLGTVTAGGAASNTHDDAYTNGWPRKSAADRALMTDMVKGAQDNFSKPNGVFRAVVGHLIAPIYYGAVVIGGGPAFKAGSK